MCASLPPFSLRGSVCGTEAVSPVEVGGVVEGW